MKTETEITHSIEIYGGGFIVCDYSGQRGKFGAAYAGKEGEWRSQPIGLTPFESKEAASAWAAGNP